jgi:hypothetical protein
MSFSEKWRRVGFVRTDVPPIRRFSQDPYGASSQEDGIFHCHRRENLKSYKAE